MGELYRATDTRLGRDVERLKHGPIAVDPTPPVLSPDGRHIAYVAGDELWVRDLAQLEPRKLAASVSPTFPFWSPDSAQVAFIAGQKLWRIPATSGQPVLVVCG